MTRETGFNANEKDKSNDFKNKISDQFFQFSSIKFQKSPGHDTVVSVLVDAEGTRAEWWCIFVSNLYGKKKNLYLTTLNKIIHGIQNRIINIGKNITIYLVARLLCK